MEGTLIGTAVPATAITSMAVLFKLAFQGLNLQPLRETLVRRLQSDDTDTGAWIDLSILEQLGGNLSLGLHCQDEGFRRQRLYRSSWPASPAALRVLAFMADGEINTNTPIDFLLEGSNVVLYSLYLAPNSHIPEELPEHDVAIVTISESDRALSTLDRIEKQILPRWNCPVLNHPGRIKRTSREQLYRLLSGAPGIFMPPTVRLERSILRDIVNDATLLNRFLGVCTFPLIARPVDSHAGNGLEMLASAESIDAYLERRNETDFFLSPFVDYRSPDGFFRKYRIMWVDGRPYPVHLAIANEWKVWYLNAEMAASPWKRAEEEQFLSAFDSGFGREHAEALACIADRCGLDYFGIDCGELPDGRLLVFEGSIALAAHDMDSPAVYPYKSPQMQRLFTAFYDMLRAKSKPELRVCPCL